MRRTAPFYQQGIILAEVLISLAIGIIITLAIAALFVGSSRAHRELTSTSVKIENGRYAIDVLAKDLWHAGHYGRARGALTAPAVEPNPCLTTLAGLNAGLALPVQVFWAPDWNTAPDVSLLTCALPNLVRGSDVVVVRRGATFALSGLQAMVAGMPYLRAGVSAGEVIIAAPSQTSPALSTGIEMMPYRLSIYYVAACSTPTGSDGTCAANDDGGSWSPSLRRVDLVTNGGVMSFSNVTIADGIEAMRVDLGLDTEPAAIHNLTGLPGDGAADTFVRNSAARPVDLFNAVSARLWVLARGLTPSTGFNDAKTYSFGALSGERPATGDRFSRSLFVRSVTLANPAGRRENP